MPHPRSRSVQTNTNRRRGLIQLAVVGPGRDDVLHGVSRDAFGNQRPDQQARDRGVAVGEVKNVRLAFVFRSLSQVHAIEAGVVVCPVVIGISIAGQG